MAGFPRLTFFAMKHLSPMDWGSMTIVGLRIFSVSKTMRTNGETKLICFQCIWYMYRHTFTVNVGTFSRPMEHLGKVSAKKIRAAFQLLEAEKDIPSDEVFDQIK